MWNVENSLNFLNILSGYSFSLRSIIKNPCAGSCNMKVKTSVDRFIKLLISSEGPYEPESLS